MNPKRMQNVNCPVAWHKGKLFNAPGRWYKVFMGIGQQVFESSCKLASFGEVVRGSATSIDLLRHILKR
jgi:hypothetical protein